jgi:hypothetical protein
MATTFLLLPAELRQEVLFYALVATTADIIHDCTRGPSEFICTCGGNQAIIHCYWNDSRNNYNLDGAGCITIRSARPRIAQWSGKLPTTCCIIRDDIEASMDVWAWTWRLDDHGVRRVVTWPMRRALVHVMFEEALEDKREEVRIRNLDNE